MVSDAASRETEGARVRADLLDLLVCPSCRNALAEEAGRLACRGCGLRYPIRDGIPVMLLSEALPPVRADEDSRAADPGD